MKRYALLLLLGLCTACGSYKAVRPDAPRAVVAEAQNNAIRYQAADGSRISAIYINSNSPMTVELRQGSTVEKLTQTHSMTKTTEYCNASTIWRFRTASPRLPAAAKPSFSPKSSNNPA